VGSVHSWNHLWQLFTSNFYATCPHSGVDWDLPSVIQKKGESLQEFIQQFYNKRNIIPEVDDKSIVMFFKKGLRDSSLTRKLAMKTPGRQKKCSPLLHKYALVKEVTIDAKEQKKEKESGHMNKPSSSNGHDKKGKENRSIKAVECP
jgi:hypothetical protein